MVTVRIIPLLVKLLAIIVERFHGITAYLSLQQIARRSQDHSSALLLIMISLSLAIFTISTAKTLDRWLYDSEHYKVGADISLQEYLQADGDSVGSGEGGGGSTAGSGKMIESFLTIEEHLALPGVQAATRFGKYNCTFSYGRGDQACLMIGVDRLEFPQAAFFREDFAGESLGDLMNALGSNLSGVILPATLMQTKGVAVGDRMAISVTVGTQKLDREFMVVGSYNYFPTVFPKDKPTLIANLDSIFNYPEDVEDYQMWLKLKGDADVPVLLKEITHQISDTMAQIKIVGDARQAVQTGQDKPERIGLFGILNVGFIATGLMPGIGFLLYSYAALRRRFIQLGILQAIGLSVRQLIASLMIEQSILMSLAILAGAGIGLATSLMFVPFLQTGATPGAPVPPFQVQIGWVEAGYLSIAFGIVLVCTMLSTIYTLSRLKVFQAVKLGETV
jgi:putative ABC transport system permease protein